MKLSIKKFQNVTDYIYGLISIPAQYNQFLDSFHLQRLRNILQCPTAKYVFPSVNHSCFEHSIGTYFLSNKLITDFKNRQNDLDINQTLINTISLCGLFHNLGTVPYLNSFKSFYKEKYNIDYDIKQKSYELILDLIKSKGIDPECVTNKNDDENFDLKIVENIFTNSQNNSKFYEKIVFNPRTGIDCDSFDNLNRDTYKYGDKQLSFDYNAVMKSAYIINNEICFKSEDAFSICDYYNSKYSFKTKYYNHRVSTSIELMITDVFKLIDNVINIKDIIDNNDKFIYFFDSFIQNIKNNEKDDNNIQKAKAILNNIDKRNLYTSIGDYYLSKNLSWNNLNEFERFNENILIENKNKDDVELKPDEIRIKKEIYYLGSGNEDPFNNLLFFDNDFNIIKLKAEDVSKLLPDRYKSQVIRVFLTTKDKDKIQAAQNALKNYTDKYKGYTQFHKPEQKLENNLFDLNKIEFDNELFKNEQINYNKDTKLGKKRNIEKGYNKYHEQLSKKKNNF